MKKYLFLTTLALLCSTLLAGCGEKETEDITWQGIAPNTDDLTSVTDRTEYYDVTVKSDELFDELEKMNPEKRTAEAEARMGGTGYLRLNTQFYQGEPVQFWAELTHKGSITYSDAYTTVYSDVSADIYLYRKDGSCELLLQDMPSEYTTTEGYEWYLDRDGNFYCYHTEYPKVAGEYRAESTIVKILSTGEIQYTSTLEPGIVMRGICQTEDGGIFLLISEQYTENYLLAQLNPDTGEAPEDSRVELPYTWSVYLGTAGDFPAVTGTSLSSPDYKFMKADPVDGSLSPVLYFSGTSYGWHGFMKLQDFQAFEDGRIEVLWTDQYGNGCLWESLQMEKVKKKTIVVRGIEADEWLGQQVARFNAENSNYHVILEMCGNSNDGEEFSRLTSVQVGSGKGPDILCGNLDQDYLAGMLEKGALDELNPYMEASGMQEEDYFPLAFSTWRQGEKIYGVNFRVSLIGEQIDEEVLGSRETPDIEALTDALLAWEGNSIYKSGYDSGAVLKALLQGTDSLWGMVDWEGGVCDFDTPLFGKLLEAARLYGDDGRTTSESTVMKSTNFDSLFWFNGQAERKEAGKVICGVLFDDGCHATFSSDYTLAINANSPNKESAWEFISYLLSEECQSKDWDGAISVPVHRKAFETFQQELIGKYALEHYVNGRLVIPYYHNADLSAQKKAEYLQAIDEARPLPVRTAAILTIILDEAKSYFDGYKSADEISQVVNNRVQLYLNERK